MTRLRDVPEPLVLDADFDDLRRDGEAVRLFELPARPVPGLPWVIKLEQLGNPDDYRDLPSVELLPFTLRLTTPVVAVEELPP